LDEWHRQTARRMRGLLEDGACQATTFRAALDAVAPLDRDAWVDLAFGLGPPPDDGPDLPRGCVPYLPCPVDALLRMVDHARIGAADLFVDVGSGVGRAAAVVGVLTGAAVAGIDVQPALVAAARELAARLRLRGADFVAGDAAELPAPADGGSVFLLYCPFSGDRLGRLLARLEAIARTRPIRVCCVDLPLPACAWLQPVGGADRDLVIWRSRGAANES
jgi:SAM-dependent methyltransferase